VTRLRRISYVPWPLEAVMRALCRLLYRVRATGQAEFPREGGVLLIANHLSYADVVALQLAAPRPLRFIGYRGKEGNWFFDWAFRLAGVIAISSDRPAEAIKLAIRRLQQGEVVAIFPEGMISRTGQLMKIERGFEVIARKSGAAVVPAAIDGLWGSIFSFEGGRYLWKRPRLLPTPVTVAFGAPLPPAQLNPEGARRALLDLGAAAFASRPQLRQSLGWAAARSLAQRPGRTVIVDRTGDRRTVSAAALYAAAAVLAKRLRATVPEARIGIALPPGAGSLVANLAVVWAGKSPVNLNFTVGPAAANSMLAAGGIRTVLSAEALRARMPEFPWPERTLDLRAEMAAAGGKAGLAPWLLACWILPNQWAARILGVPREGGDREAALLFTSGSAGRPKGVVLTHRNILGNCSQVSSLIILPKSAKMLGCLPIFHSFGFTFTLWFPLLRPCGLVTVPSPLDTRRILDAIREEEATVIVAAPTFLRPMLKKGEPADLRSLEIVVSGAEKLSEDLRAGFRQKFHLEIFQGYGLTETSPATNLNQPDPPATTATAGPQVANRPTSVGRLFPGMTARIVDPETGAELPAGQIGLLHLRGVNVFGGYLDDPERNRQVLQDGWFVTGDLAHFDDDGFLTIAGRQSRFSKLGGEMVPHGVIEQTLAEAFGLDPGEAPVFAVVGVPDEAKGEALVLLTARPLTGEELREKLAAAGLPNLWIPRRIIPLPSIPLLASGKLDLAACAARAKSG
jgi:acyl-[acyl-carrier-protein]-phospholipid O-acyltransferase/long-chain-fatty-acid--[acyl-carrier-protein] ligase